MIKGKVTLGFQFTTSAGDRGEVVQIDPPSLNYGRKVDELVHWKFLGGKVTFKEPLSDFNHSKTAHK